MVKKEGFSTSELQYEKVNLNATQLPNAYNPHGDHMDDFTFIVCHSWKIKIAFENDKST